MARQIGPVMAEGFRVRNSAVEPSANGLSMMIG